LKVPNNKLRDVFAKQRMHNLKLQTEKCEILRSHTYVTLTTQGLLPDSDKVMFYSMDKVFNFKE